MLNELHTPHIPHTPHMLNQEDMDYARNMIYMLYPNITEDSIIYRELESAAMLGLVDAARKYDTNIGDNWAHYRYYRVMGSIKDAMRSEVEQGFIGVTWRGRNPDHDPLISEDTAEYIIDEHRNPEELCILKQCWDLATEYIMTCRDETAIKLVAVILGGAIPTDVERSGNFTRVGELVNYHKPLMLRYIRERLGMSDREEENNV